MVLKIRDWKKHFENAGSRKLKHLDWVSIPNKMDGSGYTALLDHPHGAAHLGAWYAIIEIASRQGDGPDTRGFLPSLAGTCQCLGRISRIPADVFEEVIPRLLEIGWLEEIKGLSEESPIVSQNLPSSANVSGKSVATRQDRTLQDTEEQTAAGWFAQWWAIYWLHKARAGAEKAFRAKVKTEPRFQRVMAATREQSPEMLSREPSKRPYGATWLNGERWEDEAARPEKPFACMTNAEQLEFMREQERKQA